MGLEGKVQKINIFTYLRLSVSRHIYLKQKVNLILDYFLKEFIKLLMLNVWKVFLRYIFNDF